MEIDKFLRARLLKEIEKAKVHFINAAQVVNDECNEEERKKYRKAAEEPAQKLQELLDALQV